MKVLAEFEVDVNLKLSSGQLERAMGYVNRHYLGDVNANCMNCFPKHPDKETEEFKDSTYNIHKAYADKVWVQLMEDGTLRLVE